MGSNNASLKIIAQGVINSLFAKRRIRCAPVVRKVVEEDRYRFAIHLDDSPVPLIKVSLEPEEFFGEAVQNALLRRLARRDLRSQ